VEEGGEREVMSPESTAHELQATQVTQVLQVGAVEVWARAVMTALQARRAYHGTGVRL
jgi:hypothetical protein